MSLRRRGRHRGDPAGTVGAERGRGCAEAHQLDPGIADDRCAVHGDAAPGLPQVQRRQVVQGRPEPGCPEDRIGPDLRAVAEADSVLGDLCEHRSRDQNAGLDPAVVLLGQRKTRRRHHAGGGQPAPYPVVDPALDLPPPTAVELARQELRRPTGHPRGRGDVGELKQELRGRGASADHDDVLAAELLGAPEVVRVQLPPTEPLPARICGPVRLVPGACRADQPSASPGAMVRVDPEQPLGSVGGGH